MNFFNMLELDQSSTLKKILSIMKLTVVFLIAFYNPQNQKSRFQKRKIKKNGKRFVDSLYSLIDLKTI